ncbi:sortase [Candidatus Kaiserbacteria bacterium]|nr:MAG: sortase [Candidatus Kaiserbacteria bacterium]
MTQANPYAPYSSKREQRIVFFFVTVGTIALTYAFFYIVDFLPEQKTDGNETPSRMEAEQMAVSETENVTLSDEETEKQDTLAHDTTAVVSEDATFPIAIIFDSLDDRKVRVLNPESSSVEALDAALLSGVIRHPDSADFAEKGTIFLLGHSSYLPNVMNKNFQAFNGIQKLKWGDTIRLRSSDTEYVYTVDRVYEAKASSAEVPLQYDIAKLVLATCNTFASKDDRFVVEATLVDSYPLED